MLASRHGPPLLSHILLHLSPPHLYLYSGEITEQVATMQEWATTTRKGGLGKGTDVCGKYRRRTGQKYNPILTCKDMYFAI